MDFRTFTIALPLCLAALSANAAIYQCKQLNGQIAFQDKPCLGSAETLKKIEEKPQRLSPYMQEQAESEAEAKKLFESWSKVDDQSVIAFVRQSVESYFSSSLKDPDSLVLEEYGAVYKGLPGYKLRVKYRAKNGFGGYVRSDKIFNFANDGGKKSLLPKPCK